MTDINLIVIFPITIFSILFVFSYRRKRFLLTFLSLIYLLSFISSLVIDIFYIKHDFNWEATIYLSFIIVTMIYPLFFIKTKELRLLLYEKEVILLRKISTIIIIWSIFSILIYLPYVISGLSGNIGLNRINNQYNRVISSGIFTFLASIGANMFYLPQLLFFISLILKWPKKTRNLLLLSSFSVIINVLANIGRDGFILWGFTFLFLYLFFSKFLTKSDKKYIMRRAIILFTIGVIILSAITLSRFSALKKYNYDVLYSVVDYQGQQLYNFNNTFDVVEEVDKTYYLTPNIKRIVLKFFRIRTSYVKEIAKQESTLDYYGISAYVFKTYVMDLLMNFGFLGTVVFALIFNFTLSKLIRKRKNTFTLARLMMIVILIQIPAFGVYYYRQAISNFDLGILLVLMLFIYLKFNRGKNTVLI